MTNKQIEELIRNVSSKEEDVRLYAIEDIGDEKLDQAAGALIDQLMIEEKQLVKDGIVIALKSINTEEVYEKLFVFFTSRDAFLRNAGVEIFGSEKDRSLPYLTSQMDHSNDEVRKLILDSMMLIGSDYAMHAIRAGLQDDSINVQITSVEYLGQCQDRESSKELLELMEKSNEPMLKMSILGALKSTASAEDIEYTIELFEKEYADNPTDTLFIPELINLVASVGDVKDLIRILKFISDYQVYSDNIIDSLFEMRRRDIVMEGNSALEGILIEIIETNHLAVDVLINCLTLLVSINKEKGFTITESVLKKTENEELQNFCKTLIGE